MSCVRVNETISDVGLNIHNHLASKGLCVYNVTWNMPRSRPFESDIHKRHDLVQTPKQWSCHLDSVACCLRSKSHKSHSENTRLALMLRMRTQRAESILPHTVQSLHVAGLQVLVAQYPPCSSSTNPSSPSSWGRRIPRLH